MGSKKDIEKLGMTAKDLGYSSNKDVVFKKIDKIHINNFRTLKDKEIILGDNLTLIFGKNGTMKSTILGLIAHPFTCPDSAKDSFGIPLKTKYSDVFRLSPEKDKEKYVYNLVATTIQEELLEESIKVYPRSDNSGHRVVVGMSNAAGEGNYTLNTSYINLKRLYPIIETDSKEISMDANYNSRISDFIYKGHYNILQRESFNSPVAVADIKGKRNIKATYGPSKDQHYDYLSISSGEDNIGHILIKMYAFIENKIKDIHEDALQGVFCIDEIEAGLHPVAQEKLLSFLINWSIKNRVQVVATTHSLYLLQCAISMQNKYPETISINMISTAKVSNNNYNIIHNPTYNIAYKELTFKDAEDSTDIYKINIICEDTVAKNYINRIIKKRPIKNILNFITDLSDGRKGNTYTALSSLVKNGQKLLEDSIVIFDSDVNLEKKLSKYRKNVSYLYLPSKYGLPLEKEIVKYIYDLDGSNTLFDDKEKDSFINEFSIQGIEHLGDLNHLKNDNIEKYKKWAAENKKFNSYVNKYVNDPNNTFILKFRDELINEINTKLQSRSLPLF